MSEKKFVDGLRVSRHERAPEYVICQLGIKCKDFVQWLRENADGEWINIDVKISGRTNQMYAELNDWKRQQESKSESKPQTSDDGIPF